MYSDVRFTIFFDSNIRDTVSSIGVIRGHKLLPKTIDGMKHVCYFRHALALDERRIKFLPEYAYGGTSQRETADSDTRNPRHTKEVWFAGSHSGACPEYTPHTA